MNKIGFWEYIAEFYRAVALGWREAKAGSEVDWRRKRGEKDT